MPSLCRHSALLSRARIRRSGVLDVGGRVVGEGYHERKGGSRAESMPLLPPERKAGGATGVVTLGPCNHHGRTPPCRQALLDTGITRSRGETSFLPGEWQKLAPLAA